MIVFLRGIVRHLSSASADLDVSGVGYRVFITEPHAKSLISGEETFVYTYHHVREDTVQLFGFESESLRDWFELLIGVSGIGPKGALQILSGASVNEFAVAIQEEDVDTLCKLPGIGKKTAQRLVVELKEKVGKLEWSKLGVNQTKPMRPTQLKQHPFEEDAAAALVSLGYPEKFAIEKVKAVLSQGRYESVTEVIRAALQQLVP
ncbi:Holliday junction branch migration protein RuvA [Alicyclobacillus ferrooxydans]|uniref:Holliday junction branch migration complex subunit RuvA n=1 Tax=Alicyclobacillus ferrooxydans TaxID=471514 RepID=A0A0P9CAA4_9BACL|nr:Holliday junction branch migration protein RuvA [Alicyclobacillus ferrooxydans]KPV42268.1 hypothetical protein AN477_18330 [Alicyclobacillus ferrooxydans]